MMNKTTVWLWFIGGSSLLLAKGIMIFAFEPKTSS